MDQQPIQKRLCAREVGIILGEITPELTNSLVDVAGVRVGHVTLVRGEGTLVRVNENACWDHSRTCILLWVYQAPVVILV